MEVGHDLSSSLTRIVYFASTMLDSYKGNDEFHTPEADETLEILTADLAVVKQLASSIASMDLISKMTGENMDDLLVRTIARLNGTPEGEL